VIALRSGESTGQIVRTINSDGVIVSTTRTATRSRAQDPHYHENAHLCLIVDGIDVETRPGRSYQRRAGDLYFYHAGEAHASQARTPTVTSALVELGASFLARHGLAESQFARAIHENTNAPFLVLQMQHELHTNDVHTPLAMHALVLELIDYSRARYERTPPPWVRQVAQLLRDRWNSPLRLNELATACGTHPITISKQFRRYFDCSLGEYRRRLMVRQSLRLIRESGTSLTNIAFTCGFADQSHFIRAFVHLTRFRPGEFRKL
jgi:AraC family transcriptional regulator